MFPNDTTDDVDTGEHCRTNVARLNKVRVPCRESRQGRKISYWTTMMKDWRKRYCYSCQCATSID